MTIQILKKNLKDFISKINIILKKIKYLYIDFIKTYNPLFLLQNLKYFLRYFKIARNNSVFYFIQAISRKYLMFYKNKKKNGF